MGYWIDEMNKRIETMRKNDGLKHISLFLSPTGETATNEEIARAFCEMEDMKHTGRLIEFKGGVF